MSYNSSFTSQEVEQRLLQGYYDDIVEAGIHGGVLQEGEMTKQQLDLELAKRLKSPASQNGRMLLGTIIVSNKTDNIFVPNKDGLVSALNSISQTYENTIKQQYINNSQTEFFVRIGNNSNILPDLEADYEFSSIVYYIDVSLQQLGSNFEYSSFTDRYEEYKDSVGYVIYNPSNTCLRILKKFDREGYTFIDQCPEKSEQQSSQLINIQSGIQIQGSNSLENLLGNGGAQQIGSLIVEYQDPHIFIIDYTFVSEYNNNLKQQIICVPLYAQYSSTDSPQSRSIFIQNTSGERGIITAQNDYSEYNYYYNILS